ncbi:PLD nuclease N-terminal domain-containing protein [Gordonia sp. ABSL1-1]|uniref:PLD nuclease N-terminal domain-containing protein n=1 Tax=Gordonia sp. ABSL1-1 TaxID=3053923 RepID=UPI00257374B5|nr:PLD nuclease N-terminal domain-containing protein [Gordonia sp. ABSL1-1]MDL9936603.1 PLD nuclease N-terminal domain-containing protein [Gordonia sp. ABSL1-1]
MPYFGLIMLAVLVIALIDIINTDESSVRGLPKFGWIILVVLVPLVGALLWLAIGRPTADDAPRPRTRNGAEFPEYDRPGRYVPADPEADREFLQQLRDRAEEQRRIAREQEAQRRRDAEQGESTD